MDNQSLIYKYLHHEMTAQERLVFEDRMKNDPQLKKHFDMENTIIKGIEAFGSQRFKERVGNEIHNYHQSKKGRNWLYIVAMLVLLVAISGYLYLQSEPQTQPEPTKIYATHFQAPNLATAQRSNELTDLESRVKAFYNEKDYSQIITTLRETNPGSAELSLILGIAYLENGDANQSIQSMSEITEADVYYYDHKEWYTALAQVKLGQLDQAKTAFAKIAQDANHDHQKDAQMILEEF